MPAIAKDTKATVPGEDGTIAHTQLSFGNGMIMVGSVFAETQSSYVIVSDADAIYARAKAARLWTFGTYDPWEV